MAFVTHAQNFEDLMLWRALGHVPQGFYIDVGAAHPERNSVTRAFYERGWSGVNIEPHPVSFQAFPDARERDINLPVALAETSGERRFHLISLSPLSTLDSAIAHRHRLRGLAVTRHKVTVMTLAEVCRQHAPADIHFLKVDVEGAEGAVLQGGDFSKYRPWIVLAEATLPLTQQEAHHGWDPLMTNAGYRFVWFDGLNRFYLAEEHHAALAGHFRLPPNCFDRFVRYDAEKTALTEALAVARAENRLLRDRLAEHESARR